MNFDPSVVGEIRKKRPAVIISTDAANKYLNRVQVVPLISRTDRVYPSEAILTLKGKKSKAMADQIATVSKMRLLANEGRLGKHDMGNIEHAVKIQLGFLDSIK